MPVTDEQIATLEAFYKTTPLPATLQLDAGIVITNVAQFVQSHLEVLKANRGRPVYDTYYNRLLLARQRIEGGL